jgi:hypothetical protein
VFTVYQYVTSVCKFCPHKVCPISAGRVLYALYSEEIGV